MHHSVIVVLCLISLFASPTPSQNAIAAPVRVAAGTILNFHLQTRLNPSAGDTLDALPKGTVLQVRILDSIDSGADRDGTEFRGLLADPLRLEGEVNVLSEPAALCLLRLL